ncbi:MAG: tetratricopeptide repeat protein [Deltaproteobacteria bacterium]|nr:tetratricopeptide repeat protein [Deltaproteobacteria bacterium]
MSLLHDALKKLESAMDVYTAPSPSLPSLKAWRKKAVLPLLAASIASIVMGAYYSRSIKGRGVHVEAGAKKTVLAPMQVKVMTAREYNESGVRHYRLLQFSEAKEDFRKGLSIEPSDSVLYNNLGLALMGEGREDDARASFIRALELKPDYPEALNNYGALLDKEGEHKRAVEMLKRAIGLSPGYAHAHLNLAIAFERMENYDEAVSHYERYLKLGPGMSMENEIRKKAASLRLLTFRDVK